MSETPDIPSTEALTRMVCGYRFDNRARCGMVEDHSIHRGQWIGAEPNHEFEPFERRSGTERRAVRQEAADTSGRCPECDHPTAEHATPGGECVHAFCTHDESFELARATLEGATERPLDDEARSQQRPGLAPRTPYAQGFDDSLRLREALVHIEARTHDPVPAQWSLDGIRDLARAALEGATEQPLDVDA